MERGREGEGDGERGREKNGERESERMWEERGMERGTDIGMERGKGEERDKYELQDGKTSVSAASLRLFPRAYHLRPRNSLKSSLNVSLTCSISSRHNLSCVFRSFSTLLPSLAWVILTAFALAAGEAWEGGGAAPPPAPCPRACTLKRSSVVWPAFRPSCALYSRRRRI